jgi:hypothetical protein
MKHSPLFARFKLSKTKGLVTSATSCLATLRGGLSTRDARVCRTRPDQARDRPLLRMKDSFIRRNPPRVTIARLAAVRPGIRRRPAVEDLVTVKARPDQDWTR